jgi:NAD(P)-dependent dehydrogenase (short-subunit alcohol dehydrogenase family)
MSSNEGAEPEPRVAIVTGAAGGLGSAVMRRLADRGDEVVAVDLEVDGIEPPGGTAGTVTAIAADLGEWDECERVVADTVARSGRVDILVNCAAILRRTELDQVDAETFGRIFNVNCRAPFVLMRASLREMEKREWGRIVNVTSVGVHVGGYSPTSAVYEATKAAVANFTKTLARYAATRGVLINTVAPGGMRTPMLTAETPPELLRQVEADIPIGRLAEPDEVASLIVYLASGENTYASGAAFDVNGGVAMP